MEYPECMYVLCIKCSSNANPRSAQKIHNQKNKDLQFINPFDIGVIYWIEKETEETIK